MSRRPIVKGFEQPFVLLDRDFSLGKPPLEYLPRTLRRRLIAPLRVPAAAYEPDDPWMVFRTHTRELAVVLVIAAVVAMLVWFFFFAHGGSQPGTLF